MNLSRICHSLIFSALLLGQCAAADRRANAEAQLQSQRAESATTAAFGHQAWTSDNGLPQNSVHQILQTRDGYLWIATEGGIARFNGVQFTVFNQESNAVFTSNDTCCLAEDRGGALWIGTADGLLQYAGGAFRRYTAAEGLPSSVILSLAPADDGSLLVLTGGGMVRYDGQRFTPLTVSASALGSGSNGSVWLATATGILSYRAGHLRALSLPSMPTESIEGLGLLQNGSLWMRTRTGIFLWNQKLLLSWHSGRDLPGTRVQSFLADSHRNLWVGTDRGLVLLPSATTAGGTRSGIQPLLGETSILSLFEDREHNLWVGTDTVGLHILRPQRFRTLPPVLGDAILPSPKPAPSG